MQEIAQATHNFQEFNEIMPTIYRRFMEKEASEWRQIYKVSTTTCSHAGFLLTLLTPFLFSLSLHRRFSCSSTLSRMDLSAS